MQNIYQRIASCSSIRNSSRWRHAQQTTLLRSPPNLIHLGIQHVQCDTVYSLYAVSRTVWHCIPPAYSASYSVTLYTACAVRYYIYTSLIYTVQVHVRSLLHIQRNIAMHQATSLRNSEVAQWALVWCSCFELIACIRYLGLYVYLAVYGRHLLYSLFGFPQWTEVSLNRNIYLTKILNVYFTRPTPLY